MSYQYRLDWVISTNRNDVGFFIPSQIGVSSIAFIPIGHTLHEFVLTTAIAGLAAW